MPEREWLSWSHCGERLNRMAQFLLAFHRNHFTETRDSGAGCLSSGWMSCSETVNGCIAAGCKLHRNLFAIFFADLLAPVVYWREETLAMATFYES